MVINISALKSRLRDFVQRDIAGVVGVAKQYGAPAKVILETCLLADDAKIAGCQLVERARAGFVKTSAATRPGGAPVEDIRLVRYTVASSATVKASGYLTDIDKTLALYEVGARRFGTGYTRSILEGLKRKRVEQPASPAVDR